MSTDTTFTESASSVTDETKLVRQFDDLIGLMASDQETSWANSRRHAIKAFADAGLPTKKSESYKYTPATRWLKQNLASTTDKSATSLAPIFTDIEGVHIRTTDGQMLESPETSGIPGLTVSTIQEAPARLIERYLSKAIVLERDPFAALASAFAEDGIFIHVEAQAAVGQPIIIHHDSLTVGGLVQPRILVVIEEGSSLSIVELFPQVPAGTSFENRVSEVFVGKKAKADHVVIFERNQDSSVINSLFVHQEEESLFNTNTITLSGGLVRNNLNFLPNAEECETHLNGLYIAKGKAHIDNHTLVDHAKPNCFSNELFKGIVTDSATGVFNGKVLVRQDAQKTNAYQSSKSIVLDRSAQIFAKPELEIYADDVKCSHGATTGELDADALFYLNARGISTEDARMLLLQAFARDVVDLIELEQVREYLYERLHQLLSN